MVRAIKNVVHTHWLGCDAGVDALFKKYVGIMQASRIMKEDRTGGGAQADGLLRKIDNPTFLGTLYMLKFVLPHLSTLSKTFQKASLNFSIMICPNIEKTISTMCSMCSIETEQQHLNTLMLDITGKLEQCEIALNENQQEIIARLATQYVDPLK